MYSIQRISILERKTRSLWNIGILSTILGVTIILLTYNLPYWPRTWFDEGLYLQISKNLVTVGKYGIQSSEGFRLFDPTVTTGPTVLLPIAFAFKLFGISLVQARIVMVIFAILALISLYILSEHLFDTKTALLAILLILGVPLFIKDDSAGFLNLGRMVMGEMPNLLFIIIGCLLWFKALDLNNIGLSIGAGVLFGLATITKNISLLVVPALILVWIIDRLWYRQLQLKHIVISTVIIFTIFVAWSLLQTYLNNSLLDENGEKINQFITLAFISFIKPFQIVRNLDIFLESGTLIFGLPSLFYGIYLCNDRSLLSLKRCFLLGIVLIWLVWFILGSIGWMRYAFLGICLMQIFTAKLFVDLSSGWTSSFRKSERFSSGEWITKEGFQKLAIVLILAILVIAPLLQQTKEIISAPDTSPFEFASFIRTRINRNDLIESFEPEIVFLSDNNFHQPPLSIQINAIRNEQFGEPYPPYMLDIDKIAPKYLVNGYFSKRTGLYNEWIEAGRFVLIKTVGNYDLYQAVDSSN